MTGQSTPTIPPAALKLAEELLEGIRAADQQLNTDEVVPTGDDYNELFSKAEVGLSKLVEALRTGHEGRQ